MDRSPRQFQDQSSLAHVEHRLDLPPPERIRSLQRLSHFLLRRSTVSPSDEEKAKQEKKDALDSFLKEIKADQKRKAGGGAWRAIRHGEVAYVESASGVIYRGR